MQLFMVSFSASRLNAFGFFLTFLSFSFLDFLLALADPEPKKEAGDDLPVGWVPAHLRCPHRLRKGSAPFREALSTCLESQLVSVGAYPKVLLETHQPRREILTL
jgi:hypothetical protein